MTDTDPPDEMKAYAGQLFDRSRHVLNLFAPAEESEPVEPVDLTDGNVVAREGTNPRALEDPVRTFARNLFNRNN